MAFGLKCNLREKPLKERSCCRSQKPMSRDVNDPTVPQRLLGALCGMFVGAVMGVVCMIAVYNISEQSVALGWLASVTGGAAVGFLAGAIFPQVAKGMAWIFSLMFPY